MCSETKSSDFTQQNLGNPEVRFEVFKTLFLKQAPGSSESLATSLYFGSSALNTHLMMALFIIVDNETDFIQTNNTFKLKTIMHISVTDGSRY